MAVVPDGDGCVYDDLADGTVDEDFRVMTGFLRNRYRNPASGGPFFWVDFTMDDLLIRIYFRKSDLYLIGWAIRSEGTFPYFAVARGQGTTPPDTQLTGTAHTMSLSYKPSTERAGLGHRRLVEDLRTLHGYLNKWVRAGRGQGKLPTEDDREKAEQAYHLVIRTTSEMARLDGFCESFLAGWNGEWSQSTVIGGLPFNEAVKDWANLSKLARGENATVRYRGYVLTQADANQIIRNGAQYEPRT
ncbi:ribosome-inactivating family protein [Yinghuangia sp. YIM S10712]|uniref:ribosome-inactivating family protein n=1 Tax=Yinghuangia sp. YIM S10712 TaxID=3436930 RepID=UPI003F52BC31